MRLLSHEDKANILAPDWKEATILMKTVDELVYYCHECEPVGALLLSGEWGCGKTYLIEHELKMHLQIHQSSFEFHYLV